MDIQTMNHDDNWFVARSPQASHAAPSIALLGAAVDALGRQRRWQMVLAQLQHMDQADRAVAGWHHDQWIYR